MSDIFANEVNRRIGQAIAFSGCYPDCNEWLFLEKTDVEYKKKVLKEYSEKLSTYLVYSISYGVALIEVIVGGEIKSSCEVRLF